MAILLQENSATSPKIGYNTSGAARPLNGSIDEVIIENRAWSAEEVKKYYTNSLGRYATL